MGLVDELGGGSLRSETLGLHDSCGHLTMVKKLNLSMKI